MDDGVDLAQLPTEFHDLIPLIEQWAVGDDADREDLIESASTAELQRLTDALRPRFQAINAYLDEHDDREEAPSSAGSQRQP